MDCLVASGCSDRQGDAQGGGGRRRRIGVSFSEVWLLETADDLLPVLTLKTHLVVIILVQSLSKLVLEVGREA